jgi:hypothetical protein
MMPRLYSFPHHQSVNFLCSLSMVEAINQLLPSIPLDKNHWLVHREPNVRNALNQFLHLFTLW